MVDLPSAQLFLEVAAAANLSAAARQLGIAQSTLSRMLSRLEQQVGARLVERSSRAFRLTDAGQQFVSGAQKLVQDARSLVLRVGEASRSGHATLRLSLCPALARRRLIEPTAAFQRAHPRLQLIVRLEDRVADLVQENIHVAIRVGAMCDSNLSCQPLGSYSHVLVAAPSYLRRASAPSSPSELSDHPLIGHRGDRAFMRWGFVRGGVRTEVEVRPAIETNDAEVLRGMAVAGAGLTVLPDYLAEEDLQAGRLVPLLQKWQLSRVPIFAVYASAAGLPVVAREWIRVAKEALTRSGSGVAPRRQRKRGSAA